jgi:anti-anti-sigma factor
MVQGLCASVILTAREYDVYSIADLERELRALNAPHCIVDLRYVRYLDATCIAALIRALKRLRSQEPSSTLALTNVPRSMRRVFQIAHLDRLFDIRDDAA